MSQYKIIILMGSWAVRGGLKERNRYLKKNSAQDDYSNKKHNFMSACCMSEVCTMHIANGLLINFNLYNT